MRRINVRRIVIALGIGAIVTVLTAWASRGLQALGGAWATGYRRGEVVPSVSWPVPVPPDWKPEPSQAIRWESPAASATTYVARQIWAKPVSPLPEVPRHFTMEPEYLSTELVFCTIQSEELGWPWRALARYTDATVYSFAPSPLTIDILRRGATLPPIFQLQTLGTDQPLPLWPLWPGFILNTLLFSTMGYASMAGASALRRRRRFNRGLCVQCAYPRTGGNLCPECGLEVSDARIQATRPAQRYPLPPPPPPGVDSAV